MPLRVPPKSDGTCFIQPNGALKRDRPAGRHVRVGLRPAPLVHELQHVLDLLGHAVEVGVLVEHAVLAALAARAVVADDVEDERVVCLRRPRRRPCSMRPISWSVYSTNAAKTSAWRANRRFSSADELVPVLDGGGLGRELRARRHDARLRSAAPRVSSRILSQPWSNLPFQLARSTPSARGAARASRPARSRRRTACPAPGPSGA